MTSVTDVFTTSEVAHKLGVTGSYLVRVVKGNSLPERHAKKVRKTEKGPYLFTVEGIDLVRVLMGGGRK